MESVNMSIDENLEKYEREVNGGYDSEKENPDELNSKSSNKRPKSQSSYNVRMEHRRRLSRLLDKLIKCHNWTPASGVLSMLLKGTCKERSPTVNRKKYWATMELLNEIEGDPINPRKIKRIHEIWMRKTGGMKNQPKDKYSILLEFVLYCLTRGEIKEAHQAIISLMQETECGRDPIINMMVGLIFYELWYSSIPEEMKLRSSDTYHKPTLSEISGMESYNQIQNSDGSNSADVQDVTSPLQCDSDTSIGNNKKLSDEVVDGNLHRKPTNKVFQPQGFYMQDSADVSENEVPFSDHGGSLSNASIFSSCGLDASLLPIQMPELNENLENSIRLYMDTLDDNDYYDHAVKHLQFAIHSTPPLLAATVPLIQLLLLGNQIKEALNELESLHHKSNAVLPIRLRATLLECFDSKNFGALATCYEDILVKDPACEHSLTRLITMHKNGEYSVEPLVEMIALHLDATHPASSVWEDLASCFLKLSQCEEDQMSVNENAGKGHGVSVNMISGAFIKKKSRRLWMLRCRWWSTRHFSKSILSLDLVACNVEVLLSKAACASHLYGPKFEYVVSVYTFLEKEGVSDKISLLRTHMKNSVKLCENLKRTA